MGLKLASSGGGSVELIVPSTASNIQASVPATAGTVVVDSTAAKSASAQGFTAENGIVYTKQQVSASVTIPTGYSAMSAGPVTVNSGITVTVSSGSRWAVV